MPVRGRSYQTAYIPGVSPFFNNKNNLLWGTKWSDVTVSTLAYDDGEEGDVDQDVVEVTFTALVFSPTADYTTGVTIKVNGIAATINSSARQDPNTDLVHWTLSAEMDINDVVTWEYDGDVGDLEDQFGDPLGDITAKGTTNFIGAHFYYDTEWSSGHI